MTPKQLAEQRLAEIYASAPDDRQLYQLFEHRHPAFNLS